MSSFQNKFKVIVTWVLVVVISVIFIWAFTLNTGNEGFRSDLIGKVNGKPVYNSRTSDFNMQYRAIIDQYKQEGVDSQALQQFAINRAFQAVAMKHLIMDFAEDYDIHPSEQSIINYTKQKYFVNKENNTFNEQEYNNFIKGNPVNKKRVQQEAKETLTRDMVLQSVLAFMPVTSHEINMKIDASQMKKKALIAYISTSDKIKNYITDEDLRNYFEANKSNYSVTEMHRIIDDVKADYINEKADMLNEKVKNNIRQRINEVISKGDFSTDFFKASRANNMKVYKTDYFNVYDTKVTDEDENEITEVSGADFIQNLILLKKGTISQLIDTGYGLAIAMVIDEKNASPDSLKSLSFLKNRYKDEVHKEKVNRLYYMFQNNLYKEGNVNMTFSPRTDAN
jgi:hypothetical protein